MKKTAVCLVVWCVLGLAGPAPVRAQDLDIVVQDFICSGGRYLILFGVVNTYTVERHPAVAFKVLRNGVPAGCKSMTLTVPPGADGSETRKIFIDAPCDEAADTVLNSKIYPRHYWNRVGPWLADCPGKQEPLFHFGKEGGAAGQPAE